MSSRLPRKVVIAGCFVIVVCIIFLGSNHLGYVPDTLSPQLFSNRPQYCKWIFDRYESSFYEEQWFQEVPHVQGVTADKPNICQAMRTENHVAAAKAILGRVINLTSIDPQIQWRSDSMTSTTSLDDADNFMSRMHYRRVCYNEETQDFHPASGYGIQLIEPLFGMLRDPFDLWCEEARLTWDKYYNKDPKQSKLHIMPQGYAPYTYSTKDGEVHPTNWRTHGIPPWHSSLKPVHDEQLRTAYASPQSIHLDLGSSYFAGWTISAVDGERNPAASGQWFYDTYHKRGPKFDRFVAVEVEKLNQTRVFDEAPEDLIGIYTFMNIPLTMGHDKLNTIEMIKRLVKPEDFFVFKLDIDSAPIEEPIVQSLLKDDPAQGGASALIDELMFEHHVNFYPMNAPWNWPQNGDLLTSYNLFRDLRKKGIRAHSWP